MINRLLSRAALGTLVLLAIGMSAHAQNKPTAPASKLTVVELFQSQGCSSCPPAEANLNAIAGKPGILALSFGVTYWDKLGWKDTFAKPKFTDRQYDYAHHRNRSQVWTPQIYVDGKKDLVGSNRAKLDQAIAATHTSGPVLSWNGNQLSVAAAKASANCDVWLVRYDPRTLDVAIKAGENGGRKLPHRNVVRQLVHLGNWDGKAQTFELPAASMPGLATAALVQESSGGPILGASKQTIRYGTPKNRLRTTSANSHQLNSGTSETDRSQTAPGAPRPASRWCGRWKRSPY